MPRILLVDDDIAEISAVKRVLARAGHQPVLATNASDALASITQERPALLVVSATCESGDALSLARGLPDEADTAGIPLLVLGDAPDLPKGTRIVARPIDPAQLAAEVSGALAAAPATPAAPPPPARAAPAASIGRTQPVRTVPPAVLEGASPPHPAPPDPAPSIAPAPSSAPPSAPAAAQEPRRTGPANAAAARRAAAEALRARAEELRRRALGGGAAPPPAARPPQPVLVPPPPAAPPPAHSPEPIGPAAAKAPPPPPPPAPPPAAEEERAARRAAAEEARQQAADEALRALEVEASAHVAEVRARAAPANRPDPAAAALATEAMEASRRSEEERRLRETIEAARKEAFEAARRELEERARDEAAQAARRQADAEDRARAESEARKEAVAAAQKESGELARQKDEAARRQADAEARAEFEVEGRHRVEEELASLRAQLADERLKAEERVATVMKRAAAEEEAAEELRRMAEDETRQREEETERVRGEEEQKLRTAFASAQAELQTLRKRTEEEGQRRAEAEAALERAEAARREEIARREEQTRREDELRRQDPALRESQPPHNPKAPTLDPASFATPDFFAPFDGAEGEPTPEPLADPAEDAARRRVAALRDHEPPLEPHPAPPPSREPAPPAAAEPAAGDEPEEPARPISMPLPQLRAGNLADLSAPRLLALAARAKLEGRLDFQGEVARSIWFENGRVVGATSAEPSERVEEVALRLGLITRDQHRRMTQAAATLPSRRAALLLLERGFLKASELTGLVRRRTEEVVFGIFAEEDGRFRWVGAAVPPEERTTLERPPLALAVEGVRRRWLAPRVDALLGGPATLLMPVQGGPAAADLGLSPEERRLASLADGLRTLDELVEASPLDDLSSRQVLAALVLVGALTVRLVQGGRPAAQAAAAIDLARVKDKLEQVRRADYFTVLGVGRHGTPHEVREAADRLQGEFDPRRFAGVAEEGLPARLAEILQVIQDAREVLADDRLREEYLRGLGDTG